MPTPAEQRVDQIGNPADVLRYAVSAQISRLPEGTTNKWVAQSIGMRETDLSHKLSANDARTFSDDDLRKLDQIFVAASAHLPSSPLSHIGGTRALGARVRGLDAKTALALSPAEWTPEWLADPSPPRTEFELLGQASALLSAFMTPSRRAAETRQRY